MNYKRRKTDIARHHECECFMGDVVEAAESEKKWNECSKNPGHLKFISAQDFKMHHLPKIRDVRFREALRSRIDLTVRLRVRYTSRERSDDDDFAIARGTKLLRTGTGLIDRVYTSQDNKSVPVSCVECGGDSTKKHWRLEVTSASHVVFNTEEAKETMIDLFLDEEGCDTDGRMKSVNGMQVVGCRPDRDRCFMLCVTCDQSLGARIESAWRWFDLDEEERQHLDLSGQDFLPPCRRDRDLGLIVSHPHGQPKKITVGTWTGVEDPHVYYTIPTCPGSSGAPVFKFGYSMGNFNAFGFFVYQPVHSGSCVENSADDRQVNYGFDYLIYNRKSTSTASTSFVTFVPPPSRKRPRSYDRFQFIRTSDSKAHLRTLLN